jgi:hypothetical protein
MDNYIKLQIMNIDFNWDFLKDKTYQDIQWHGGCIHFNVDISKMLNFSAIESDELKISSFNINPESFWSIVIFIPEFKICILWDIISDDKNAIFSSSGDNKIRNNISSISAEIIHHSHSEYKFYVMPDDIQNNEIQDFYNFLKTHNILNWDTFREYEMENIRLQPNYITGILESADSYHSAAYIANDSSDSCSDGCGFHYPPVYDVPKDKDVVDTDKINRVEDFKRAIQPKIQSNKSVEKRKLRLDYRHIEDGEYILIFVDSLIQGNQKWITGEYTGNFNINRNLKLDIIEVFFNSADNIEYFLNLDFNDVMDELEFIKNELQKIGVNEVYFDSFLRDAWNFHQEQQEQNSIQSECVVDNKHKFNKFEID